ncbi:hypothetical protein Xoosp13_250 [Xanthomonas phage Xoo-sp13]|nr:hypothetical protein Xoosp13_250 [Xanthomonas phage Xoo-sp13]
MKYPLVTVPTENITVDNQSVSVLDLPLEIQNEIKTLDVYNQDRTNAVFKLEQTEILYNAKLVQIKEQITEWVSKKTQDTTSSDQ